ncbi:MAG: PhnD/SsuA/transferrin family substrate-binding protein [Actinobacteria bacterium]|nr:PhnD/SsuA/transferrin family substrate-binding protein [Actinomycetota bacterium]
MIASLSMYPFAHLRDAYDTFWSVLRSHLPASVDPPDSLAWDVDLDTALSSPALAMGQTCAWPLVTRQAHLTAIGSFDVVAPFAAGGRYRSVLVASKPLGIEHWKADPAAVVARNGPDSLSGWISLQWAWRGTPDRVVTTGGHVASMRAVAAGEAQVASIDALSFEFLAESEPATVGHLNIIDHGPLVPSLPLAAHRSVAHVDDFRAAIEATLADPRAAEACARLRIRGFVPFDDADYQTVRSLVPPPAH